MLPSLNHSGLKVQRLKIYGLKVRCSDMKLSASSLERSLWCSKYSCIKRLLYFLHSKHHDQFPTYVSPIPFTQLWDLFLKQPWWSTFYEITNWFWWRIFNMHMYMSFAYNSFENSYVFTVTYLYQQLSTSFLGFTSKYMIPIFCNLY